MTGYTKLPRNRLKMAGKNIRLKMIYTRQPRNRQTTNAMTKEKAKEVALGVASGAGVAAAAAGGVVLGVTHLLLLPAVLKGAGAATAVGGGVVVLANKY